MIDRRELLRISLLGSGAAVAGGGLGSLLARAALADGSSGPVVETKVGKLRGATASGAHSFKGVHYGASTDGSMRFLPAVPPKPWTGVVDALDIGSPAPQDLARTARRTSARPWEISSVPEP